MSENSVTALDRVTDPTGIPATGAPGLPAADQSAAQLVSPGHSVPLGDTGWRVWRDFMVRSAGFPIAGLAGFSDPVTAAAVDEHLRQAGDEAPVRSRIAVSLIAQRVPLERVIVDPAFREAVIWQNPFALQAADRMLRDTADTSKRRQGERMVARYWQRYCAKNETIGFFGPAVWGRVSDGEPALTVRPGPALLRQRTVVLEDWALAELANAIGADPAVHPHLPIYRMSHLGLRNGELVSVHGAPIPLTPLESALLEQADGRAASVVAAELVNAGRARNTDDVRLGMERLAERDLVRLGFDVPAQHAAEAALRAQCTALVDPLAKARAEGLLNQLLDVRDRVAAAAGEPAALGPALAELDATFAQLAGVAPTRRAGQTYAGRSLCFEETTRDVAVTVGTALLDAVAEPLAILLRMANWVCARLEQSYLVALDALFDDLAQESAAVRLADLWFMAQGLFFGAGERPVDEVSADFVHRWQQLLGVDSAPPSGDEVQLRSADLADRMDELFPKLPSSWPAGRLHSPDLQIAATDPAAIARGDFRVVLGEMHAGWATFDSGAMTLSHPAPDALRDALAADLGTHRLRLLYPDNWPRFTGRLATVLGHQTDRWLAFSGEPSRGVSLPDVLRTIDATVIRTPDGLRVTADGDSWPLIAAFSELLATQAVDSFKLTTGAARTPRVSIDRLVVSRSSRRTTCAATALVDLTDNTDRYLAVRALRQALDLPELVFVSIGTETKPVYIDLSSPLFASVLATMVRAAALAKDGDVAVTFSEMLPAPPDCFLVDADSRHYVSELRFQCVSGDPTDGSTR